MLAKTPSLFFQKDKKKAEESINDKDVPIKLIKNVIINWKQSFLPLRSSVLGERLADNKEWNKIVYLHLDLKVKNKDQ